MIPVSIVIVTRNEEKNIRDALESVKDFDEIIIVDSYSNDKTVQICKEYTDKVYQHEWQGYSRQKQIAIDYAKKKWVFILDADERITLELKEEISQLFTHPISQIPSFGFLVPRKNYFLGKWIRYGGWWPDYTLRLFRKDFGYIEQREVHEKVILKGNIGHLNNPLVHYTYDTISNFIAKMQNYSTLAAKEIIKKKPSRSLLFFKMFTNPFFTFFKMYILKQGFRDGIHGLILSKLYSFYTFLKYLKAWELIKTK